jgi:hypothetical protein
MRICWPNPDATCLEGGCVHCQDGREIEIRKVKRWAGTAGLVKNRYGGGTKDALEALRNRVGR